MHKRQPADLVSLVLPAYNEEPNIRPIYDSIQRALGALEHLEIIFVDDGSSDGTAQCVRQFARPQLRASGRSIRGSPGRTRGSRDHPRLRSPTPP